MTSDRREVPSDQSAPPLKLALHPSVVRRACLYAVVVGAILITINHGDALIRGDLTRGRFLKMLLTVCVPYVVSTLSSVGALRSRGPAGKSSVR